MNVKKWSVYILLLIVAIMGIVYGLGNSNVSAGAYDDFARCLNDNGAKMFGAYWCPHCQNQKEMFGRSWDKVNYIECSLPNGAGQNKVCNDAGIEGYPTWEFADGSRISGVLSLDDLGSETGCVLNVSYG